MNPVQVARGIEKTAVALVAELKLMSRQVLSAAFIYVFVFDFVVN